MDGDKMTALGDLIPEEACTALDLKAKSPGFTNIEVPSIYSTSFF